MRTTITKQQLIDALPVIEKSTQAADELSKKFGINRHFFRHLRSLLGYCPERIFRTTQEQRKHIKEELKKGEFASDIAKREGLNYRYVLGIAKSAHIKINHKHDFWTDRKIVKAIQFRNKGYSFAAVARMIEGEYNSVRQYIMMLEHGQVESKKELYESTGGIKFHGRGKDL